MAPRPAIDTLPPLPDNEQQQVRQTLQYLERSGSIKVSRLMHPTYRGLLDFIHQHPDVSILHFDGHGSFGRPCDHCWKQYQRRLYPNNLRCDTCGGDISDTIAQGFLAFKQETGQHADWIRGTQLSSDLCEAKSLQLAVLSACSSATVRDLSVFSGVGPLLIQAGIPAVVATQLPITAQAAVTFSQGFYGALVAKASIAEAVNQGRRLLAQGAEWFTPVLYLRSASAGYPDEESPILTGPVQL